METSFRSPQVGVPRCTRMKATKMARPMDGAEARLRPTTGGAPLMQLLNNQLWMAGAHQLLAGVLLLPVLLLGPQSTLGARLRLQVMTGVNRRRRQQRAAAEGLVYIASPGATAAVA